LRRCLIAVIAQISPPTKAAPINAQAHPGRSLDSEDFEALLAAAAPAAAAAPRWSVEVLVVCVGVVTVLVWITVFVCVGDVTVLVCVTVFVRVGAVTVVVADGAVAVAEGVVAAVAVPFAWVVVLADSAVEGCVLLVAAMAAAVAMAVA
jgi:hypothetical protein